MGSNTNSPFHKWFSRKHRKHTNEGNPLGFDVVTKPNPNISIPGTPKSIHSFSSSVFTTPNSTIPPTPSTSHHQHNHHSHNQYRPSVLPFTKGNQSHSTICSTPISIFDATVPSDHSHLEYETSIGDVLESYFEDVDHYLLSPFSESNSASATTTPCGVIMVGEVPGLPTTSSFDSISLDWEEEEEEGSESIDNSVYESTTIRDVSFEFFKRGEPGLIECCQNRGSTTTPTQLPPLSKVPAFPVPPTPQRTPVLYFDPFDHSQSDTQEFNFNMIQQC